MKTMMPVWQWVMHRNLRLELTLCEWVDRDLMLLERIDTKINMSDHFTKSLSHTMFHRHTGRHWIWGGGGGGVLAAPPNNSGAQKSL
jgi:hypothetical protein